MGGLSTNADYYDMVNRANRAMLDIQEVLDIDVDRLCEEANFEGQQSILRQLKEYCMNGQLKESYLDAVIKPPKSKGVK